MMRLLFPDRVEHAEASITSLSSSTLSSAPPLFRRTALSSPL
jgi:hypothetical protein